ncbi:phospholipase D-like domain-containing protein [Streptomyces paludis]|uniref:PLD phosphodiesterase domain-containing protein n=1 Tax=Streptomyces paludis TaxID=2282738 RepID=A0A345HVX6_9ACTN|nr:hypothetical protein [Streptomyces paludis]AXG80850.1 hypothetical protein DVK44_27855 [Streptomyces paludis]
MNTVTTVYVPCDVVRVHVRMDYGDTLSPIEELVLRAIHAGLDDVPQLVEHLHLGSRLIRDLVYDLWRQGHLTANTVERTVAVSRLVAECLRDEDLKRLRGAESAQETRDLMIEKLAMRVLPASGWSKPPNSRFTMPLEGIRVSLAEAPEAHILQALRESLRRDEQRHQALADGTRTSAVGPRAKQVHSYRIPPPGLRTSTGQRWIDLIVTSHWDDDHERLTVTVVDERMPAELREGASQRLTQLAVEYPRASVFVELRRQAQTILAEPPSAPKALDRLARRVAQAPGIPAGQRRAWHHELADDARQLDGLLRARVEREIEVRIVDGADQARTLNALITDAQQQLVVVSPWIRYRALGSHLDALTAAVQRGVTLVLVWGPGSDSEYEDTFDEQTRNALEDLARGSGGRILRRVVLPRTSSRTHAKLVVADHRTAFVTSRNPLSSDGSRGELGVELTARDGTGETVVRELLDWVRTAVPSYEHSQTVRTRPVSGTPSPTTAEVNEPPSPAIGPPEEDSASDTAVRLWAGDWQDHVSRCRDFLGKRVLPSVRPVTDSAHRTLLRTALTQSRHQLVIASGGLSDEAVDQAFLTDLRACLERGVRVTLVHPGPPDAGQAKNRWQIARATLAALREEFPDLLTLNGDGANHAKAIVWDDEAVVGSFNYLSFEGRYGRRRLSSELSVRLTGQEVADAVAEALGATLVARPEPEAEPLLVLPGPGFRSARLLLEQRRDDGSPDAEGVRRVLADAADPWEVLDGLGEDGPTDLLRIAAARCLTTPGTATGPGTDTARRSHWTEWLVRDRWQDHDFVQAAILRHTLPDPDLRPRPGLALLAAARGTPRLTDAIENLVLSDMTPAEVQPTLLAAVGAVLLQGSQSAADALSAFLADTVEGVWLELAERTGRYWTDSYVPVPMDLVRSDLRSTGKDRARAQAWEVLERLLDHARASAFDNTVSNRTHRALFDREAGEFAVLADIVAERAPGRLTAWRSAPAVQDLTRLIERVGAEVSPGHPPMHGDHLKRYLKRLEPVLDQAATVAPLSDSAGHEEGEGQLAAARELGDWLAARWRALSEATAALTGPEGRLADAFLADLEELARWRAT